MKKFLNAIFDVIFVIAILFLIRGIIQNNITSYAKIIIYIILMLFIYKKIQKVKIKKYMFILLFLIIVVLQIVSAYFFKVIPAWDFGSVYNEANVFSEKIRNLDYFCRYPNNIPVMFILKTIFYICKIFGLTHTLNIGIAVNIIAIDLSIIMLILVIKELLGKEKAFFTLLFVFIMPIIYLAVPIFYTDTFSMSFPILIIYIYIKLKKEENKKKKTIYSILLGVVTVIGINIKITVGITFIAILIYEIMLCKEQEIKNILYSIFAVITIVTIILSEVAIFKFAFKDLEKLRNESFPITHFIMMALSRSGRYNPQDVRFTASFKTKEEKINANIEEIKVRLREYDTFGKFINFIRVKELQIWNDGTYFMPTLLSQYNVRDGKIHNLIYEKGFIWISKLQRELLMVMMLVATFYKRGKKEESINIISRLSILGLIIFFSFWEISSRYIINYIPILTLIEILGMEVLNNRINEFKEKIKKIML